VARCPFANHSYPGKSPGRYSGGPYRIVHHTTEGSSASGAIATYRQRGLWPHFTAGTRSIYQHLDTSVAASAVMNQSGGVETNRLSAVQIELVGYAGRKKDRRSLANVARLCRWLESAHGIPTRWPNGPPRYGTSDPGGHNRSVANWRTKSGHYGHSQVPENRHWDPSYWPEELAIVMGGAEMADLDRINHVVNGTDQTARIKTYLQGDVNTLWDATDWCDYASYAKPTYDPRTRTLYTETAKVSLEAEGAAVPPPSAEEFAASPPAVQRYLRALELRLP
jgi:N-acetylmuramoyl-L-alanine amidase